MINGVPIMHFSLLASDKEIRKRIGDDFLQQRGEDTVNIINKRICKKRPLVDDNNSNNDHDFDIKTNKINSDSGAFVKGKREKNNKSENGMGDGSYISNSKPTNSLLTEKTNMQVHAKELSKKEQINRRMLHKIPVCKKDLEERLVLLQEIPELPVVICVAKNRTRGALESNVELVGRVEGLNLWYFS